MNKNFFTSMGGAENTLQTTQWTEIINIDRMAPDQRRQTVNAVMTAYWKPVYCYLRRKGFSNEKAKDITQGFFYDIMMGRNLLSKAERARGKLRKYIFTALNNYTRDIHTRETALKRTPKQGMVSLDTETLSGIIESRTQQSPAEIFHYSWAIEVLHQVIEQTRQCCESTGRRLYWRVFCDRELLPVTEGRRPRPIPEICREYGIETPKKASNMSVYVKRKFAETMRSRIRGLVENDEQVQEEFDEIIRIINKTSSRTA